MPIELNELQRIDPHPCSPLSHLDANELTDQLDHTVQSPPEAPSPPLRPSPFYACKYSDAESQPPGLSPGRLQFAIPYGGHQAQKSKTFLRSLVEYEHEYFLQAKIIALTMKTCFAPDREDFASCEKWQPLENELGEFVKAARFNLLLSQSEGTEPNIKMSTPYSSPFRGKSLKTVSKARSRRDFEWLVTPTTTIDSRASLLGAKILKASRK